MLNRVLGIDIGLRFGWAVLDGSGVRIDSGCWDLRGTKHEGGGIRLLRLKVNLERLLQSQDITLCGYELVQGRSMKDGIEVGHIYGELRGVLKSVMEEKSVPYGPVSISSAKRTAFSGTAKKADMIREADLRWDCSPGPDEADALWVAETIRQQFSITGVPKSKWETWRDTPTEQDLF